MFEPNLKNLVEGIKEKKITIFGYDCTLSQISTSKLYKDPEMFNTFQKGDQKIKDLVQSTVDRLLQQKKSLDDNIQNYLAALEKVDTDKKDYDEITSKCRT